jgi:hypothetical protein
LGEKLPQSHFSPYLPRGEIYYIAIFPSIQLRLKYGYIAIFSGGGYGGKMALLHNTTSDRRRSGRHRETTLRQDRHITLIHLRIRCVSAVDTARTPVIRNNRITDQTVHNRLRQSGLCSRHPLKGMELKRLHQIARLQWARARLRWSRHTWQNILFSDESKFNLTFHDGRVRIYSRRR